MPLAATCKACGYTGRVPDSAVGKVLQCPKCSKKFIIQRPGEAPPAPPKPVSKRPVKPEEIPDAEPVEDAEPVAEAEDADYAVDVRPCPECGADMPEDSTHCEKCGHDIKPRKKKRKRKSASIASQYEEDTASSSSSSSSSEGSGLGGLFWFIMIFGVGNAILYYFTGFLIIPIRR